MLLAADLGSKFGWAVLDPSRPRRPLLDVGTWVLWTSRDTYRSGPKYKGSDRPHPGLRWQRLEKHLAELSRFCVIDEVTYELVRRHAGTKAAQAYGGAQAILLNWACSHSIPVSTVSVQLAKKAATDSRAASKESMILAMQRRFPNHAFNTDDAADAAAIGLARLDQLGHSVLRIPKD